MSAEHGPNPGTSGEFGQALKPAVEGPSFAQNPDNIEIPNQLNASLLKREHVRVPVPGPAHVPERFPKPRRGGHGVRNAAIGVGATVAAGLIAVGSFLGIDRMRSSDQDPETGGAGATVTQVDSGTETVVPTSTPFTETPTPISTPTAEKTPTQSVDDELSHGQYKTVEEMPVSDVVKDTIKEMLEGSEAFIITDSVIIAIENDLKTRTHCPDAIGSTQMILCTSMDGIKLNTSDFPDSSEKLERGVLMAKYFMWENDAKSGKTFEQYEAEVKAGVKHPYIVKAYDGDTGEISDITIEDENTPYIIKFVSQPDRVFFENLTQLGSAYVVKNGVLEMDIYTTDAIGTGIPGTSLTENYQAESMISTSLTNQVDPYLRRQILDGTTRYKQPLSLAETTMIPFVTSIDSILVPESKVEGRYTLKNSIFRQNGEYHNKDIPRNNYK